MLLPLWSMQGNYVTQFCAFFSVNVFRVCEKLKNAFSPFSYISGSFVETFEVRPHDSVAWTLILDLILRWDFEQQVWVCN